MHHRLMKKTRVAINKPRAVEMDSVLHLLFPIVCGIFNHKRGGK